MRNLDIAPYIKQKLMITTWSIASQCDWRKFGFQVNRTCSIPSMKPDYDIFVGFLWNKLPTSLTSGETTDTSSGLGGGGGLCTQCVHT